MSKFNRFYGMMVIIYDLWSEKMVKKILAGFLILFIVFSCSNNENDFSLVIHGGAGSIYEGRYSAEEEQAFREKLTEALAAGHNILLSGGTSNDCVEAVVRIMEDSPLFNAGKGAVLNAKGNCELDASFMDGSTGKAGAVGAVSIVKNPISLSRKVMEKSKHVFLVGKGAEEFARENKLAIVDNSYFITEENRIELQKMQLEKSSVLNPSGKHEKLFSTVGCVARDKFGNITAGTSTGGMMNKKFGRLGDVPVIGAGTYADNNSCGISATGHGEFFIRNVVAYDISALMRYKGLSLDEAAEFVVNKKLVSQKGAGGIIGIDKDGEIVMKFNTSGMFRGYITQDGLPKVYLYNEK